MEILLIKVLPTILFAYVMTRPDHAFDPTAPFRAIVVTGMLSCFSFFVSLYVMMAMHHALGWPDDTLSSILHVSFSVAACPFVLLKFYWDHIKSQREVESREW